MLLVVVVNDSEEDRHEDVGVDEDVDDEEDSKPGAGVVRRHPGKQKTADMSLPVHMRGVARPGGVWPYMTSGLLAVVTRT